MIILIFIWAVNVIVRLKRLKQFFLSIDQYDNVDINLVPIITDLNDIKGKISTYVIT